MNLSAWLWSSSILSLSSKFKILNEQSDSEANDKFIDSDLDECWHETWDTGNMSISTTHHVCDGINIQIKHCLQFIVGEHHAVIQAKILFYSLFIKIPWCGITHWFALIKLRVDDKNVWDPLFLNLSFSIMLSRNSKKKNRIRNIKH